jgi:hypothetical protein
MKARALSGSDVCGTRRSLCAGLIGLAGLIAFCAPHASAGNIFDDDWTPPRQVNRPRDVPAQPPPPVPNPAPDAAKPPAVPPATPPAIPPPPADAAPPPAPRHRAIPGKAEQARSRALLKQAFATQLKDRSPAGRKKLAEALLAAGPRTADNSSDEFVLLCGTLDAAREASLLRLCFTAADQMAAMYDVDALSVKSDAALKVSLRGDSPAVAAENVKAAMELIDPLMAAQEYPMAAKILTSARPAAASEPALASVVQQRLAAVEMLRIARDRVQPSLEKLKTAPNDPAANLAVGKYLCFSKHEWEAGIPLLARGSDSALKHLATLETARPAAADDIVRIADGWWDLAAKESGAIKHEMRAHAAVWYQAALSSVNGLTREKVEKRIQEMAAETAQATASVSAGYAHLATGACTIELKANAEIEIGDLKVGELIFSNRPHKFSEVSKDLGKLVFVRDRARASPDKYTIKVLSPGYLYFFGEKTDKTLAPLHARLENMKGAIAGPYLPDFVRLRVSQGEEILLTGYEIHIAASSITVAK